MKIYLGADHQGYQLKEQLQEYLEKAGYDVVDLGNEKLNPEDDFPQFAGKVAMAVLGGAEDDRGILICGSGQGMCMAANRFKGIRASLVWDVEEAGLTRNDNDSNVLCLPSQVLKDKKYVEQIVETWLHTPFAAAPRYIRRNKELDEL